MNEEEKSIDEQKQMNLRQKSPEFSIEEIQILAKDKYELDQFVCLLPSERDQNFLFERHSRKFILKISNIDENYSVLDMQIQVLEYLNHQSKVIPTNEGKLIFQYKNHYIRLINYLPGIPLGQRSSLNLSFYFNLGKYLAELDQSLEKFSHPAGKREIYWDIKNASKIIETYFSLIENEKYQKIIQTILNRWQIFVQPKLNSIRMSIIHNDANDYNILVIDEKNFNLIDFGDMCYTYEISEIAIACAYSMLNQNQWLNIAKELISGYHLINPLNEIEKYLILDFILIRLAMSVSISAYEKTIQPENQYLFISEKSAWNLLETISQFDQTSLQQIFLSFFS